MSGPRDVKEDLHVEDESDEDVGQPLPDSDDGVDPERQAADDEGHESDSDEDATGSDEGQEGQQDQVAPTRGQNRFQRLANEAREAKEKADRLEREMGEFRARSQPNVADQIRARREAELKAAQETGDPNQYYETRLRHQSEDTQYQINRIAFETADGRDAASFARLCARRPEIADLESEVEKQLAILRSQGGNAQREVVAKFLLGDRAFNRAAAAKTRAKTKADVERTRERGAPVRSGGDVPATRQRGGSEKQQRENRLKDIQI